MSSKPFDARARLRLGDQLVREGRYVEAINVYMAVASFYLDQGFALKAVAIAKQIVALADRDPHALLTHAHPALLLLVEAYRALGLDDEALTVEARLRAREKPS